MIHRLLRSALPAPVSPRLGLARDAVDRARFRPYVARHVYGGRALSVDVAANGLTQVVVMHAAGAEAPGVLRFSPRMNGHVAAPEEASAEVRALTIVEVHVGAGLERFGTTDDLRHHFRLVALWTGATRTS